MEDRLWPWIEVGLCWEWQRAVSKGGYGVVALPGRHTGYVHRLVWELLVGPIPKGVELDHLCRNRRCCNPDHIEPVTHAENMRRSGLLRSHLRLQSNQKAARVQCPSGHPFDKSNTYITKRGWRVCRTCQRDGKRRRRQERRGS